MGYYSKHTEIKRKGNHVEVVNDQVDKALRKFKKKVMESGLLQDLREREFYEKPTSKRKRAKSAAKNRWQKKIQAESLPKKLY
jgi:small subunit ribosomal protein S21